MSNENKQVKRRDANIELLRIIAMIMILVLHYLGKSNSLITYEYWDTLDVPKTNIAIAWLFEAFSYGATNLYVLICGYFLVSTPFRIEKGIILWLQVFFYSAGIALIFLLTGNYPDTHMGLFWFGKFCLPIVSNHYWFASIYLFLFFLSPFIATVAKRISKKNLATLIIVLLLLFSRLWHDLLPFSEPIEDRGMGIGWFVTIFFVAAYLRLYYKKKINKYIYLVIYLTASILVFISIYVISCIAIKTGKLGVFSTIAYNYNSILVAVASIALFLFFREIKIKDGIISKFICKIAGLTFGVYLIHEHTFLRGWWVSLWHADEHFGNRTMVPNMIISVAIVFVACSAIEYVRQVLFNLIYGIKPIKILFNKISVVDNLFKIDDNK